MKTLILFFVIFFIVSARVFRHQSAADCRATGSTRRLCLDRSQAHGSNGRYRTVAPVIDSPSFDGTKVPICGEGTNLICVEVCCHSGNAAEATCTVQAEWTNRYRPNGYRRQPSLGCCPAGEFCVAKGAPTTPEGSEGSSSSSSSTSGGRCAAIGGHCADISGIWSSLHLGWLGNIFKRGCAPSRRRPGFCPGGNEIVCCV